MRGVEKEKRDALWLWGEMRGGLLSIQFLAASLLVESRRESIRWDKAVFIFVDGLEKIIFVFKLFWYIDIKIKF